MECVFHVFPSTAAHSLKMLFMGQKLMDCGLCERISGSRGCRSPAVPWTTPVSGCFQQWARTTVVPGGTGQGLAPRYHDLMSRTCAFGRCVLFTENEGYLVCVSSEPAVPAALLSWGLLPHLEGLKVMGMEVEEGNRMKGIPPGKW